MAWHARLHLDSPLNLPFVIDIKGSRLYRSAASLVNQPHGLEPLNQDSARFWRLEAVGPPLKHRRVKQRPSMISFTIAINRHLGTATGTSEMVDEIHKTRLYQSHVTGGGYIAG
jgi:hypothetical protein